MTVASIHQNSFVVNVEWSVKISCGTCTSFYFQSKTYFIYSKQNCLKKLRIVSSDPRETPYPIFPIFKERP